MDLVRGKKKKGLIIKTWERCKSFGGNKNPPSGFRMKKSKSWPRVDATCQEEKRGRKHRVTPEGCFSVYVGPHKQKFVIKTQYLNHPLFRVLLEEAELEYGYNSEGPLALPCKVDVFLKALIAMDSCDDIQSRGCVFSRSPSSYHLLSPI